MGPWKYILLLSHRPTAILIRNMMCDRLNSKVSAVVKYRVACRFVSQQLGAFWGGGGRLFSTRRVRVWYLRTYVLRTVYDNRTPVEVSGCATMLGEKIRVADFPCAYFPVTCFRRMMARSRYKADDETRRREGRVFDRPLPQSNTYIVFVVLFRTTRI